MSFASSVIFGGAEDLGLGVLALLDPLALRGLPDLPLPSVVAHVTPFCIRGTGPVGTHVDLSDCLRVDLWIAPPEVDGCGGCG